MKLRSMGWWMWLGVVACTAGDSQPVESPGGVLRQSVDSERTFRLTEEFRIGGDDEKVALFRVRSAALDSQGNMYVLEAGNQRVSVFDPSGMPLHQFGRAGEGPGDLMRPRSLSLVRDTIAIGDSGNRLHFFELDGTHIRTRVYLDLAGQGDGWYTASPVGTPEGWLLPASAYFRRDASGSDQTGLPPLQRMRLFWLDGDGDLDDAGYYWEHEQSGQWSGVYWIQAPFTHNPTYALDGLGRIHMAATSEYVIDVYDHTGRPLRRIENDVPRTRVSARHLDEWRASHGCTPGQVECDPARTDLAMSLPIPQYLSEVGAVRAYVHGHIAVMRLRTDPDPEDNIMLGDYDFFDPDGHFIGTLPAGTSPRWFDGETLIVTEWDELGVESLIRYRVELPDLG